LTVSCKNHYGCIKESACAKEKEYPYNK